MSPEHQLELILRLALALLLGALIGVEREANDHPAGVRTLALVASGSALFTAAGAIVVGGNDPTRVAAQVVTGIGFLGAGAIVRQGTDVKGLTTAASIWVTAAVGMAAGFGLYLLAVLATGLVLVALYAIRPIEHRIFHQRTTRPPSDTPVPPHRTE